MENRFSPDTYHEYLLKTRKPVLAFDESRDYDKWRIMVKEKLTELLGDMPEEIVPYNICIEYETERDSYIEKRFTFDTEPDMSVPCHLLVPKNAKKPCPVVICLQGHSTGMHISLGKQIYENDVNTGPEKDYDYAIQAVMQGYAALVMEQRGFGERISEKVLSRNPVYRTTCFQPAMVGMLLGRTLIGERVWDISRAIDVLETFPEIDSDKIACMGNSGGGTATYYAACMDERIKLAMPSCMVCTFDQSIGIMYHCACNYIPRMAKYFDFADVAALIAPRKLIVVAGEKDNGFLIEGSKRANATIEAIYKKAGCPENVRFVTGKEGHRFYAEPSWKIFAQLTGWEL